MRANRLLGAALVEANLVKIEDLESANERLIELMQGDAERQATLLGVLMYEKKVLKEDDLLHHIVENEGIGLVDLRNYDVPEDIRKGLDVAPCWATWSVPFDKEEEFHFIASAYCMSEAVRDYWKKQLGGNILWYATTLEILSDFLEKIEVEHKKASAPPLSSRSRAPFPITPPSPVPGVKSPGSQPPLGGSGSAGPLAPAGAAKSSNTHSPFAKSA